jgi:hypothetical protein
MKKDLSQPLKRSQTQFRLFIRVQPDKYVVFRDRSDDCGCNYQHSTLLAVDIDESAEDVPMALIRTLRDKGMVFKSSEELLRLTTTSYSYVDDTPGEVFDIVYLLAEADLRQAYYEGAADDENSAAELISFGKFEQETAELYSFEIPMRRAIAVMRSRQLPQPTILPQANPTDTIIKGL